MIFFSQTEQSTSLEKLREIEKSVGLTLPGEYVEHMLEYNGGKCKPSVFSFVENGVRTESNVDWFLAIYDGEYDNLETYFQRRNAKEEEVQGFREALGLKKGVQQSKHTRLGL